MFGKDYQVLDVDYNRLLADPCPQVRAVSQFLGGGLDEDAMAAAVDPALYRNRAAGQGAAGGDTNP